MCKIVLQTNKVVYVKESFEEVISKIKTTSFNGFIFLYEEIIDNAVLTKETTQIAISINSIIYMQ